MSRFIATLDASLLYSMRATSLTLNAANTGLFQPTWSADIHAEWTRSVMANNPALDPTKIHRRRDAMDRGFPAALITDYRHLIDSITLPDPNDRHVVAAAIRARADVIVTFNLADFPAGELAKNGLEAQHPDTFLVHQLTLDPARFIAAVRKTRTQFKNPPYTVAEFVDGLRKANLPILAQAIAHYALQL